MFQKFAVVVFAGVLAGCASKSSEITPAYVSPLLYQNYSCNQLAEEAARITARAQQVAGVQDSQRTTDGIAVTVAVVVFWPAAFAIKGDGNTAAELSRLKGELETIEKVAIQKKCAIKFERPKES